jgi:hypothetical protein
MPSHVPGPAPSEVQQILSSEGVSSKGGEASPGYIIYFLSVFPKYILLKVKRARNSVADCAGTGKGNGSGEDEGDKTMEGDGARISEENSEGAKSVDAEGDADVVKSKEAEKGFFTLGLVSFTEFSEKRGRKRKRRHTGFIICFLSIFHFVEKIARKARKAREQGNQRARERAMEMAQARARKRKRLRKSSATRARQREWARNAPRKRESEWNRWLNQVHTS